MKCQYLLVNVIYPTSDLFASVSVDGRRPVGVRQQIWILG
jgi:hypothetical protein